MSEYSAGRKILLNSLPGNLYVPLLIQRIEADFQYIWLLQNIRQHKYVCARPWKDTHRSGALLFLYLENRTIDMQEDIQLHCGKTSVCIMALLTYP